MSVIAQVDCVSKTPVLFGDVQRDFLLSASHERSQVYKQAGYQSWSCARFCTLPCREANGYVLRKCGLGVFVTQRDENLMQVT
jgi:hypothetical protein